MIRAKTSRAGGRGQGGSRPLPGRDAFRRAGAGAARARGYTLLEVLIAFSLLAIGLGLLLSILSGGVRSIANAADSTRASLYAESVLDSLGADRRLQPGRSQGSIENGRYHWTLDISSYATPAPVSAPGGPPTSADSDANQLLHVVLLVQWGSGRGNELKVETLRAYARPQVATQ